MKDEQNKKSQLVKIVTSRSQGVHVTDKKGSSGILHDGSIYSVSFGKKIWKIVKKHIKKELESDSNSKE